MRTCHALAFALLALPSQADTRDLPWWNLELTNPPMMDGAEARVLLSLEDARKILAWEAGPDKGEPAWLERVDWEKWMVVVVPWASRGDEGCDVVRVTAGKAVAIEMMRDKATGEKAANARGAMAILMERFDHGIVSVNWVEGSVKEMRARRDCDCTGDTMAAKSKGQCGACGRDGELGAGGVCHHCHGRQQTCATCGKRLSGRRPLREEKK